jgi:hypothetical protein
MNLTQLTQYYTQAQSQNKPRCHALNPMNYTDERSMRFCETYFKSLAEELAIDKEMTKLYGKNWRKMEGK